MQFAVIESMTKVNVCGRVLRVWRNEEKLEPFYDNHDIILTLVNNQFAEPDRTIELVAALPRVTAVELVDVDGNGAVVYNQWP